MGRREANGRRTAADTFAHMDRADLLQHTRLRPLGPGDAAWILRLNSDPEVLRFVHDVPFADLEAAAQWIMDIPGSLPHGIGRWAIEAEDGTWVGRCSLRNGADGTAMGYRLLREHWGKGHATRAVRRMLELAFGEHGVPFVVSSIHPDNQASRRVIEKNGGRFWKVEQAGPHAGAQVYRFDR